MLQDAFAVGGDDQRSASGHLHHRSGGVELLDIESGGGSEDLHLMFGHRLTYLLDDESV